MKQLFFNEKSLKKLVTKTLGQLILVYLTSSPGVKEICLMSSLIGCWICNKNLTKTVLMHTCLTPETWLDVKENQMSWPQSNFLLRRRRQKFFSSWIDINITVFDFWQCALSVKRGTKTCSKLEKNL